MSELITPKQRKVLGHIAVECGLNGWFSAWDAMKYGLVEGMKLRELGLIERDESGCQVHLTDAGRAVVGLMHEEG